MDPRIFVRRATKADAHAIATVHIRAWQQGYAELMPAAYLRNLDIDNRAEFWRDHIEDRDASMLVAMRAGVLLGWSRCEANELMALNVAPEAWSTGVGGALWTHARNEIEGPLRLWVLQENRRARAFYEARGCHPVEGTTQIAEVAGACLVEVLYQSPGP